MEGKRMADFVYEWVDASYVLSVSERPSTLGNGDALVRGVDRLRFAG